MCLLYLMKKPVQRTTNQNGEYWQTSSNGAYHYRVVLERAPVRENGSMELTPDAKGRLKNLTFEAGKGRSNMTAVKDSLLVPGALRALGNSIKTLNGKKKLRAFFAVGGAAAEPESAVLVACRALFVGGDTIGKTGEFLSCPNADGCQNSAACLCILGGNNKCKNKGKSSRKRKADVPKVTTHTTVPGVLTTDTTVPGVSPPELDAIDVPALLQQVRKVCLRTALRLCVNVCVCHPSPHSYPLRPARSMRWS